MHHCIVWLGVVQVGSTRIHATGGVISAVGAVPTLDLLAHVEGVWKPAVSCVYDLHKYCPMLLRVRSLKRHCMILDVQYSFQHNLSHMLAVVARA